MVVAVHRVGLAVLCCPVWLFRPVPSAWRLWWLVIPSKFGLYPLVVAFSFRGLSVFCVLGLSFSLYRLFACLLVSFIGFLLFVACGGCGGLACPLLWACRPVRAPGTGLPRPYFWASEWGSDYPLKISEKNFLGWGCGRMGSGGFP